MSLLNKTRRSSYTFARFLGDVNSLDRATRTGSAAPIVKRLVNKWIGRNLVSKMWWR